MAKIMVADIETTGIHLQKDDPIQIAYVVYDGREKIEEREIYLKTEYLPAKITEITGITKAVLDERGISHLAAAKMWNDNVRRINPEVLVGHNIIGFDLMLLNNWLLRTLVDDRFPLPPLNSIYDTMMMARSKFGMSKWLSLKELAEKCNVSVDVTQLHNAVYDIDITAKCYFVLTEENKQTLPTEKQAFLF